MGNMVKLEPTLQRWLSGERIGPLPARDADQPPPLLSFEFFPPKTEALEQQLGACIRSLAPLAPRFVSVTYGAGGSTHARTHATVSRLASETDLVPAAHLTCVGATRDEVDAVARGYWEAGVRHVVALRGDPPVQQQGQPDRLLLHLAAARRARGGRRGPALPSRGALRRALHDDGGPLTGCLLASGQISMRKLDGWQTPGQPPAKSLIGLAA